MNVSFLQEYLEFGEELKYTVSSFNKLYFRLFNEKKSAKSCLIQLIESNKELIRMKNTIYGARIITHFEYSLKLRVKELELILSHHREREYMEMEDFDVVVMEVIKRVEVVEFIVEVEEVEEITEVGLVEDEEINDNDNEVKELTYEEKAFNAFTRFEPYYEDLSFSKIYEMYKEYGTHVFNDDDHCKYSHKMFYYADKYADAVFAKYSKPIMTEEDIRNIISKYIVKHYVPIARVEYVNSRVHNKFEDKWFEDDIFEHLVLKRTFDIEGEMKKLKTVDSKDEKERDEKKKLKLEERKNKITQIEKELEESRIKSNEIYQKYLLDGKIMECIDKDGYEFLYNDKKYIRYGRYYLECDENGSDQKEVDELFEMGYMRTMDVENKDDWRFNFDYTFALSNDFQTKRVIDILDYKTTDKLMEITGCEFRKSWMY
jgi:hypothetical protein